MVLSCIDIYKDEHLSYKNTLRRIISSTYWNRYGTKTLLIEVFRWKNVVVLSKFEINFCQITFES